jgi:hypothetical protein
MPEQRIVMTITPESDQSCRGCQLLKGINVAQCQAGFSPRFEGLIEVIRPQECRTAVETVNLISTYLNTWNQFP